MIEKGSEIAAHILSGAVLDPIGINELIPNWSVKGLAPIKTLVKEDHFWIFTARRRIHISYFLLPPLTGNQRTYAVR